MLKIISITENPRRKKRKAKKVCRRKVIRARKNPSEKHHLNVCAANVGLKRKFGESNLALSKRIAKQAKKEFPKHFPKKKVRTKIIRARKNMGPRPFRAAEPHRTVIAGIFFPAKSNKPKTVYFTGKGFSRKREDAQLFSGDGAKFEAKRILPMLPPKIERIWTQAA